MSRSDFLLQKNKGLLSRISGAKSFTSSYITAAGSTVLLAGTTGQTIRVFKASVRWANNGADPKKFVFEGTNGFLDFGQVMMRPADSGAFWLDYGDEGKHMTASDGFQVTIDSGFSGAVGIDLLIIKSAV